MRTYWHGYPTAREAHEARGGTYAPDPDAVVERWVHATNAGQTRVGGALRWRSDESPTGWYRGRVLEIDPRNLRVRVGEAVPA